MRLKQSLFPWLCAAIVLLSLAVRVGWVAHQTPSPAANLTPLNDSTDYDLLARNVLAGRGFVNEGGNPSVIRPPLYPAFMAATYAVAGVGNLAAVGYAQAILSALATLAVIAIARRFGAPPWAALLAGVGDALYPVFFYQTALILTESLYRGVHVLAVLTTLRAAQRGSLWLWAAAGALWGAAALCRPIALPILVLVGLWSLFLARPRDVRHRLLALALLGLGAAMVVGPWMARNVVVSGRFIPVAANYPVTMVHGTSHLSTHARRWYAPEELIPVTEELLWHTQLRAFDGARDELRQQDAYAAQWRSFAREHPGLIVELSLRRAVQFWSPVIQNDSRTARLAALASMAPVLLAGWVFVLLGTTAWRRRPFLRQGAWLCLAVAVAATLPHALSMPDVRYRTATMDPLWVAGAAALIGELRSLYKPQGQDGN